MLKDRVVIITGSGGNIGRAYCDGFLDLGAKIIAADIGDQAELRSRHKGNPNIAFAMVDISNQKATDSMAELALEKYGKIDGLINNAGFFKGATFGSFMDIPPEEWDLCYRINVRGLWQCCKSVFPAMKKQGSGSIVNISSNTPYKGIPNFLHYTSSKMAIVGLSRSLAREVGKYGITVNTLCPDLIPDQDIINQQGEGPNQRTVSERCIARTQLPEDMVGAAAFLLSKHSSFITGQSLLVNGGALFN